MYAELMPHKYKFLGMAGILLPVVVCTGFAAYIGRALVELRNWRWIYYIYLIIIGESQSTVFAGRVAN